MRRWRQIPPTLLADALPMWGSTRHVSEESESTCVSSDSGAHTLDAWRAQGALSMRPLGFRRVAAASKFLKPDWYLAAGENEPKDTDPILSPPDHRPTIPIAAFVYSHEPEID